MAQTPSDDALFVSDKEPSSEEGDVAGAETPVEESPEEREQRMVLLKEELEKVESEIAMLRQVLGSKVRHASELKRQLGITPFQEFKQDLQQGIHHIKSSDSYQKTSAVVKTASEKTTSAISSVGQAVARKMGDIRNSQTFKSFDERVHSTYANMKAKVTGSRSSSEIDEAFRDAHANEEGAVTTPEAGEDASKIKLPEEKVPL